jgi:hypothetical protein
MACSQRTCRGRVERVRCVIDFSTDQHVGSAATPRLLTAPTIQPSLSVLEEPQNIWESHCPRMTGMKSIESLLASRAWEELSVTIEDQTMTREVMW